jgi:hypothetical protein
MSTRIEGYADLTREELVDRLERAEDVCVLFAWTGTSSAHGSDRELALTETWMRWAYWVGDDATRPAANPHLNDEEIRQLAQERRNIRAATLRRIQGEATR